MNTAVSIRQLTELRGTVSIQLDPCRSKTDRCGQTKRRTGTSKIHSFVATLVYQYIELVYKQLLGRLAV